ncbi:MAG: hypothetical protein QOH12_2951 [Solirubrobacteraceae bacterium]|jgi:hypothetical protein|nr:hypothetical protein [Solirubrobacteraceae bacterium]
MSQVENTASTHARDEAFALLRQVADDFHAQGRRALGAVVKPEMVRRSYGGFVEPVLGFSSFKDFVLAAHHGGFVDTHPAPSGPDIEIVPPGAGPQPAQSPAGRGQPTPRFDSVRDDLWRAATDWTPGLARAYDRDEDRVVFFAEQPAPLEPAEHTAARRAWDTDRDRFRLIEPVGMDGQIEWMREFTSALPSGRGRTIAELALNRERPFGEFARAVRQDLGLNRMWQIYRKERVADWLRTWMLENKLDVDIFIAKPQPGADNAPIVAVIDLDVEAIRGRLHKVIDRMPASELLRLSIPFEYVIE